MERESICEDKNQWLGMNELGSGLKVDRCLGGEDCVMRGELQAVLEPRGVLKFIMQIFVKAGFHLFGILFL